MAVQEATWDEALHPRSRRGEWAPKPGSKVRLRRSSASGAWGRVLEVVKTHSGLAEVKDRDGQKHTYAITDLQPMLGTRLALAEAIEARKAAKTSDEFVIALAREQLLREWVYCDEHAQKWLQESVKTAGYSVTPHPFGKPGGPGLWKHKGLMLPAYIQNVAHGIQKSGKTESEAIASAVAIIKRWAAGGGGVHPEVKAAAAKALAEWEAKRAAAHGASGATAAAKAAAK
jgi:hypothetical protein